MPTLTELGGGHEIAGLVDPPSLSNEMQTLAIRSSRQTRSRPKRTRGDPTVAGLVDDAQPAQLEDVAVRAARLGITAERVLQEYARIAFADLRHIVEWGPGGLEIKTSGELSDADAAAIAEIIAGSAAGQYRVKLYDKKAALDAIARHLGMFAPRKQPDEADPVAAEEDPRAVLERRLARLAAGAEKA